MSRPHSLPPLLCASLLATLLLAACRTGGPHSEAAEEIPYTVMQRYFQSNRVKQLPKCPITRAEQLDSLFGRATVMGRDGKPTPVDFTKEYVIAVSVPSTRRATTLQPVSLRQDRTGNVVFTYQVREGKELTYSQLPCLLIKVSRTHLGPLLLNELHEP